ncbi:MAG TPA: hypothetical protein VLK30_10530 [Candidatus Limnocylindrales bacterium]|nr:hypothetical protein [Candidatus Limnocylindrales bacterium]
MDVSLLLPFSIALLTGMVAATFVPAVHRAVPRPVEILLWVAFVSACVVGIASITDPNARELNTSVAWAANQLLSSTVGLMLGGVSAWIAEHRFVIATWLVVLVGADIFALVLMSSRREARSWQPRVRLREWMELPVASPEPVPAHRRLVVADPLANIDRRLAGASAIAGAALLATLVEASIWFRNVMVPREARRLAHAAAAGRVESRARLDSLRDATSHLQYAARSWYAAAGEPAISSLATHTARAARRRLKPIALKPGEVIDIQALLSAQSIGWYGPLGAAPKTSTRENDVAESQPRTDRLAS